MTRVYPILVKENEGAFLVYIPDWEQYTEGKDFADAMNMARDCIGLMGITYEDMKKEIPEPSNYEAALLKSKANKDIFDYSDGVISMVDIDFVKYRRQVDNKSVKKNCTLPYWLTVEADKAGINYSRVLQDAIANMLNLNYNTGN